MEAAVIIELPWRDPLDAARPFADQPFTLLLTTPDGWTYLAREPDRILVMDGDDPRDAFAVLAEGLGTRQASVPNGPPFQGGWAGLLSYEFGARAEPVALKRHPDWPDMACGFYSALLAFSPDHRLLAVGRGWERAQDAAAWLDAAEPLRPTNAGPMAEGIRPSSAADYEAAVSHVVARIGAGDQFQANIARRWCGRLLASPYALYERLCAVSPAPFAGYLRLPGRAVVSNSPERFIRLDGDLALTQPIKGTRPRGEDAASDAALAEALLADPKDRAENLMIVDLMRNDLARVSRPGGVDVPALFELQSFANVHHLVSTVTGRLVPGAGPAEVLKAAFPPGSITGAPKVQAMKTIAALEPPRGPYCGSLFWAGVDGAMDSSVLIRTLACVQDGEDWRFEAGAGAGITSDSEPVKERLETEAKIAAILGALTGDSTP